MAGKIPPSRVVALFFHGDNLMMNQGLVVEQKPKRPNIPSLAVHATNLPEVLLSFNRRLYA